jgi:hypothetical protein
MPLPLPYKLTFDLGQEPNRLFNPQKLTSVPAFLPYGFTVSLHDPQFGFRMPFQALPVKTHRWHSPLYPGRLLIPGLQATPFPQTLTLTIPLTVRGS